MGFEAVSLGRFNQGKEDRSCLARAFASEEQPVFGPEFRWTDRVFDEIVIDLDGTVVEEDFETGPLVDGVAYGFAEVTFGQIAWFEHEQCFPDPMHDRGGLGGAHALAQGSPGTFFAQSSFDPVKLSDLVEYPCDGNGSALAGFVKLSAHVSPTACEFQRPVALLLEACVGSITVALQVARKAVVDDPFEAFGTAAGIPVIDRIATGHRGNPKVALSGFARSGLQIRDRGLVDLQIGAGVLHPDHFIVNRLQPPCGQCRPAAQRLPGDVHAVAGAVNLLLAIQRKMVGVFAYHHLSDQIRGGQAPFLQTRWQGGDHRRGKWRIDPHELATNKSTLRETPRTIVELFGDFLADVPPF